jgi:hypothetical protein
MTELRDGKGTLLAHYITPMECRCVRCKQTIVLEDGMFVVLGFPYYCCLHRACAPHFGYTGEWPHPFPSQNYNIVKKI